MNNTEKKIVLLFLLQSLVEIFTGFDDKYLADQSIIINQQIKSL
jgi:hypothetical protein